MISEQRVFLYSVIGRILTCVLLVRTSFVPDEYWQSLEPAYLRVFGYGLLTWEWRECLRSALHPLFYAAAYAVVKYLKIDFRAVVVLAPRLQQAVFSAIGDVYFYKLTKRLQGEKVAFWAWLLYELNWFNAYCGTRTLINATETTLVVCALYVYPWPATYLHDPAPAPKHRRQTTHAHFPAWQFYALGTVTVYMRPTAALIFGPMTLWHWCRIEGGLKRKYFFVVRTTFTVFAPLTALCIYADKLYYRKWVVSLWNFVQFNVIQGGSALFGKHPWHWYVTQGLPAVLTIHIVPILLGIRRAHTQQYPSGLLNLCSFFICCLGTIAHKEFRFVLPILPLLCCYAGIYMNHCVASQQTQQVDDRQKRRRAFQKDLDDRSLGAYLATVPGRLKAYLAVFTLLNACLLLFFGLIHQRAPLTIMTSLHRRLSLIPKAKLPFGMYGTAEDPVIDFLTPCHALPGYTHLHLGAGIRHLTCEPNLVGEHSYRDEADRFFDQMGKNATATMQRRYVRFTPLYVVVFEGLYDDYESAFNSVGFHICEHHYFTKFHETPRQSEYMLVLCQHRDVVQDFMGHEKT